MLDRGRVLEGCSEVWVYLFSLHVPRSCKHFYIHCILFSIYIWWCMFFTLSHMCCFFFPLYTHVSSFIQLFYVSHLMPWWILWSLPCHDLFSYKNFQEFIVGLDLCTFVCYGIVVLDFSHNCYLWFCKLLGSYLLELANLLTKCTLLIIR